MRYIAISALVFSLSPSFAADLNGYTAQYECRAGGPKCNVDVAALTKQPCLQTVSPSTPWSDIDWSKDVICIGAGDHTAKETLTIPSWASGTATKYKVLRYDRPGDVDDPWDQSSANQAKVVKVIIKGSYWIIQRLTLPSIDKSLNQRIQVSSTASDIIVNRVLVEGMSQGFSNSYSGIQVECCDAQRITIQNSVVRNSWGKTGSAPHGITPLDGDDIRIVNNEIYDWSAHPIQMGRNGGNADMAGYVIENNDIYQSPIM